jgi:proline dehydrogenase
LSKPQARWAIRQWGSRLIGSRLFNAAVASPPVRRLLRPIEHAYVASDVASASAAALRFRDRGFTATFGYWHTDSDTPRAVLDQYLACIRVAAGSDYISAKIPGLGYSTELFAELAAAAAQRGLRIHFDAEEPDTVERSQAFLDRVLAGSPARIGWTLPGRWPRSVRDVAWAAERGLRVRVVKGMWAHPEAPDADPRHGYLQVIEALCRQRIEVAVAGHDIPIIQSALSSLRSAGVACELELLRGLPWRSQLQVARRLGLDARVYVGYGRDYLKHALAHVLRHPRVMLWIAGDMLRPGR